MKYLETQEELEILLGKNPDVPAPTGVHVIYFTANWCGACRSLDMEALVAAFPQVNWLKCDVDRNTYSPGFCGVRAIPSFMFIRNGKAEGPLFQHNKNANVAAWLQMGLSS
jgi:thioredoxin 1